jgi:serine/threonine-protein kinase
MGDPLIGQDLQGGFHLVRRIGAGDTGVVYEARRTSPPDGAVAVKVLHAGQGFDAAAFARSRVEVQSIIDLGHPQIVRILELDRIAGGPAYVAMELLQGESLDRRLQRDGALAPQQVLALVRQAGAALQAGHDRGVVHRDLRPKKVFLPGDPGAELQVKLLDFGLSLLFAGRRGLSPGQRRAPQHLAPEQAGGGRHGVTVATDVYALAAVTYHCLTGRPPFDGQDAEQVLAQIRSAGPPPLGQHLPGATEQLQQALARALAKQPLDRPRRVADLVAELVVALEATLQSQPRAAGPPQSWLDGLPPPISVSDLPAPDAPPPAPPAPAAAPPPPAPPAPPPAPAAEPPAPPAPPPAPVPLLAAAAADLDKTVIAPGEEAPPAPRPPPPAPPPAPPAPDVDLDKTLIAPGEEAPQPAQPAVDPRVTVKLEQGSWSRGDPRDLRAMAPTQPMPPVDGAPSSSDVPRDELNPVSGEIDSAPDLGPLPEHLPPPPAAEPKVQLEYPGSPSPQPAAAPAPAAADARAPADAGPRPTARAEALTDQVPPAGGPPPRRASRLALRIAVGVLLLAGVVTVAVLLVMRLGGPGDRAPAAATADRAGAGKAAAGEAPARQITVILKISPQNARVYLDGELQRARELTLPATGRIHQLKVGAAGHLPQELTFRADTNRMVRISLTPR